MCPKHTCENDCENLIMVLQLRHLKLDKTIKVNLTIWVHFSIPMLRSFSELTRSACREFFGPVDWLADARSLDKTECVVLLSTGYWHDDIDFEHVMKIRSNRQTDRDVDLLPLCRAAYPPKDNWEPLASSWAMWWSAPPPLPSPRLSSLGHKLWRHRLPCAHRVTTPSIHHRSPDVPLHKMFV